MLLNIKYLKIQYTKVVTLSIMYIQQGETGCFEQIIVLFTGTLWNYCVMLEALTSQCRHLSWMPQDRYCEYLQQYVVLLFLFLYWVKALEVYFSDVLHWQQLFMQHSAHKNSSDHADEQRLPGPLPQNWGMETPQLPSVFRQRRVFAR